MGQLSSKIKSTRLKKEDAQHEPKRSQVLISRNYKKLSFRQKIFNWQILKQGRKAKGYIQERKYKRKSIYS